MSYSIRVGGLRKSIDFVNRDIEYRCRIAREVLDCEKEGQDLEARCGRIVRLTEKLFAYGGEPMEEGEPLGQERRRLEEKMKICREKISDFAADYRQYPEIAAFLEKQAEEILNPEDSRLLFAEEKPRKFCPELTAWSRKNGEHTEKAFQVKALLLQTFLRNCTPGVERRALAAVLEYLELVKPEDYASDERSAFLSVIPYLTLKGILHRLSAGEGTFGEEERRRMEEALRRCTLGSSAYPVLVRYQTISQAGFMGEAELWLLGDFYEYFSEEELDGAQYARAWLTCFDRARNSRKYYTLMKEFLEAGLEQFLRFYNEKERKYSEEIIRKCLESGFDGAGCGGEENRPGQQGKSGGKRKEGFPKRGMLLAALVLGILMGTNRICCYIGILVLACIVLGSEVSEKTHRNLLACYAMYLVSGIGEGLMGYHSTLFYLLAVWDSPASLIRKAGVLTATVILPVVLYVFVRRQSGKSRKERETV